MHKLGSKSYVFVERLNEFIVVCKCFELIQTVSARVTRFVSNGGSFSKMNLGGQHVTTLKGTIYVLLSLRNACRTVIFLLHPLEMCFFWSMTKLYMKQILLKINNNTCANISFQMKKNQCHELIKNSILLWYNAAGTLFVTSYFLNCKWF